MDGGSEHSVRGKRTNDTEWCVVYGLRQRTKSLRYVYRRWVLRERGEEVDLFEMRRKSTEELTVKKSFWRLRVFETRRTIHENTLGNEKETL